MKFKDDVVIVTGAAQGIGKVVAEAYAEQGAKVVLADQNEEKGAAAAAAIRQKGETAIFVACDVRSEEAIVHLMNTAMREYGKIDILINNAGYGIWKSPLELSLNEWDDVMNTNVRSCFLTTREAAKYMGNNKQGGAVINMASTRATMSEPNSEAYAASKGAIVALTHAMAVSLADKRIRVNSISPGWIEKGDYSKLREIDHVQHPSQRVGKPEDIARACLFLTAPDNDFVTGENLVIDGGMTRKMIYEP
ncbi:SDR family NAD(P)-dependent oxidoreductase [Paenibacillus shunpengii]|uniref:SDR family NAD(P)-dependent oxidoreductase n=1 Tax=Paenibacillus shunpengii TaxID=2054424 RepID=A0ABW5SRC7_9BACL|nr:MULTISPECIES: glucose 1-dehydrogenase [unclassified Paenibacillus]OMC68366.1 3-ketoacyl-ACP reductase [Paenibacillus sp. FSL H7-0326]SDW63667.1 NAD(P)-dependent dehydrogenase, short-chain alcohol dehydrogenase family [Paenibacillus sp. PDC88]